MTQRAETDDTKGKRMISDERIERLVTVIEDGAEQMLRQSRSEVTWRLVRRTVILLFMLAAAVLWVAVYGPLIGLTAQPTTKVIGVVTIDGVIGRGSDAGADSVVPAISEACGNARVHAVVLRINSPGGSPSEADRIGRAIETCRRDGERKEVVAVIEGAGASAAYMVAVRADHVVAGEYSQVGSIGAVMRSFDAAEAVGRLGVHERVFASGALKAGNSAWSGNTPEQDALNQAMVDEAAGLFADMVRAARGDRLREEPDLFSGRTWLGDKAQALGLIDEVAVYEEVLGTRYPGLPTHTYKARKSIQDRLGFAALVQAVARGITAQLQTTELE